MKVIVAGSRTIVDASIVGRAIEESGFDVTEVVSGRARGVDRLGEEWAHRQGIHVQPFPADWIRYGSKAGPIRNQKMAEYANALVAVWDGKSTGTRNMIELALRTGLPIHVVNVKGKDQ